MDNSTAPFTLCHEGQAIALVRGIDGWETTNVYSDPLLMLFWRKH